MPRRLTIINLVLFALILAASVFLFLPKYRELKAESGVLKEKSKALKMKNDYYLNLRLVAKRLDEKKDYLNKIDSALPKRISLPAIFNFIEKISDESGLSIDKIDSTGLDNSSAEVNYDKEADNDNLNGISQIKKVILSVSLSGTYSSFKNFLNLLYKNARIFNVNSINLSSGSSSAGDEKTNGSKEETGIFNFSLSLETYVLPTESSSQTSDNPSEGNIPKNDILPPNNY